MRKGSPKKAKRAAAKKAPKKATKKAAKVEEPEVPLNEINLDIKALQKIHQYVEDVGDLSNQIADLTALKKKTVAKIEAFASENRLPNKVRGEGWLIAKQSGEKLTLKKELLVQKGVSMKVINAATVKTPWESTRVYFDKPGAAVEETEE